MEKKFKILKMMFEMGWTDEAVLLSKGLLDLLNIPEITMDDIIMITEIQNHVLDCDLYSYLAETEEDEHTGEDLK